MSNKETNGTLRRNDPPLAPHEDQDGWLYIRVKQHPSGWGPTKPYGRSGLAIQSPNSIEGGCRPTSYVDSLDESRIIASARVERAVENDDILRLCAERHIVVTYDPTVGAWPWGLRGEGLITSGESLRKCYDEHCRTKTALGRLARENFR